MSFPLPTLTIGTGSTAFTVDPPLVLAPMSGVTDSPFRRLVKACSGDAVGLVVTEFISVELLTRRHMRSMARMHFDPSESPLVVQIFGADVDRMAEAAKMIEGAGAVAVDLNCGCPAPKVVRRGGGAALLRDVPLIGRILEAMRRAVSIPVTIKIRNGWCDDSLNAHEVLRVAEASGASALGVHGRTRLQLYRGAADWEVVRSLKQEATIPILGSGDVVDASGASERFTATGCDGLLIGRAAITNPWVFRELIDELAGTPRPSATWRARIHALEMYVRLLLEHYPAKVAPGRLKMMLSRLIKGLPDATSIRRTCLRLEGPDEMLATLRAHCRASGVLDHAPTSEVDRPAQDRAPDLLRATNRAATPPPIAPKR